MPRLVITKLVRQVIGVGGAVGSVTRPVETHDITVQELEALRENLTLLEASGVINWTVDEIPPSNNDQADGAMYSQLLAVENATRLIHTTILHPANHATQGGQGPTVELIGSVLLGLHFDSVNDDVFQLVKIPTTYVGDGSFHIHWTKSSNSNDLGKVVRWEFRYVVFDGKTEDVNVAGTLITADDTYDDAGTTTRIVHRTSNVTIPGLVAGYYLGILVGVDDPNTTITNGPVLITCDLLMREQINLGA